MQVEGGFCPASGFGRTGLFRAGLRFRFGVRRPCPELRNFFRIADDLGSDYCGFYEDHGDTVKLPNVRRLLSRGVRFRNAWSNPLCSSTRASILTGRHAFL
jgi:hypothetical protein